MKLIKPNVEIIEQQPGLEGMYKQIELAGRTCYKSEDKITEDSAKAFVDRMIKSGHGAMLEHGTVYLKLPTGLQLSDKYKKNKYSIITLTPGIDPYWAVTTNYRVLVENNWLDDLQYICEPTEYHEKRITVKWTCDRVTGESFLRHRVFSFARESTRYCNYSKDKFGNELTFMIPTWVDDIPDNTILHNRMEVDNYVWGDISKQIKDKGMATIKTSEFTRTFLYNSIDAEINYMHLVSMGYKPQQARQILPFSIHSPLVMTGFESDWKGFFALRSPRYGATGVHPDAAYLADKLYDLLYIEKDYDFSLIHHDAFDGECSFLNDGDMITYHSLHDKNKDSYTIESVTITPKEGEIRTLSREEYLKLTNNTSNESHLSFKAELLDLSESKIKKSKKSSEECEGMYRIIEDNGNIYYVNSNNYEKEKEFRKEKEEEFGSKQTNISR